MNVAELAAALAAIAEDDPTVEVALFVPDWEDGEPEVDVQVHPVNAVMLFEGHAYLTAPRRALVTYANDATVYNASQCGYLNAPQ